MKTLKSSYMYALQLFGSVFLALLLPLIFTGERYVIYGEAFYMELFILPLIVLVTSIYVSIKTKKWFIAPLLTITMLSLCFYLFYGTVFLDLLSVYTGISLFVSVLYTISYYLIKWYEKKHE